MKWYDGIPMIWKAVRHILAVEVATWTIFGLVLVILGTLGVRSSSAIFAGLAALWIALFLTIYRIRYKRL